MSKKIGYGKPLSANSNAKINLFLYVLGKRDDGYHNIYSLFAPIDLSDTITITPCDKTIIVCNKKYIPVDNKNIILQVDNILRKDYGITTNFHIELIKRIPVGAGLGGGSSNAATYLNLVLQSEGIDLPIEEKEKIMLQVGSDTLFFLYNKPALVAGRGEISSFINISSKCYVLIIYPNKHISTKNIYSSKDLLYSNKENLPFIDKNISYNEIKNIMKNDLEVPVFKMYPYIKEVIESINQKGNGVALMSGSGSTVFGLYDDENLLNEDYDFFSNKYKDFFIKKAKIIDF